MQGFEQENAEDADRFRLVVPRIRSCPGIAYERRRWELVL